ncbi:hypothetical protein RI367_006315 [Sorochytrium milnesiophthora]
MMDPSMIERLSETQLQSFAQYADRHGIYDLFAQMLKRLVVEKPSDPLAWMEEFLLAPQRPAVVLIAPPVSGAHSVCEQLAGFLGAIPISTSSMLRVAIERQTQLGMQAKPYMNKGALVPDHIMLAMLQAKLAEPAVKECGYVLEGYPKTKDQALLLQRKGVIHNHVFIIDVPDQALIHRAAQMHVDPVTGSVYDLSEPHELDPTVRERLVQKSQLSESVVRGKLDVYRRDLVGIRAAYHPYQHHPQPHPAKVVPGKQPLRDPTTTTAGLREMQFDNIVDHTDEIVQQIITAMQVRDKTRAPVCIKVIVHGSNPQARRSACECIAGKLEAVHISVANALLHALSAKSPLASVHNLQEYINSPDSMPADLKNEVVCTRLRQPDCQTRGWVLEEYPNSVETLRAFTATTLAPNRVIFLVDPPPPKPEKPATADQPQAQQTAQPDAVRNLLLQHFKYRQHALDSSGAPTPSPTTKRGSVYAMGNTQPTRRSSNAPARATSPDHTSKPSSPTARTAIASSTAPDDMANMVSQSGICQDISTAGTLTQLLERVENAMLRPIDYKFKAERSASI